MLGSPASGRVRARSLGNPFGPRYRFAVVAGLWLVLAMGGGASRADEAQQTLVRLTALVALAATLWPLRSHPVRPRGLVLGISTVCLLPVLQLVPLPPVLWSRLPGHAVYGDIAREAGAFGWRPLSLTPDLTLNAILALLPAAAAALGALYLDHRSRIWLAEGIVGVALISVGLGLLQLSTGTPLIYRETSPDSAVGLFANRNHEAAFLACALPLTGAVACLRIRHGADLRVTLAAALSAAGVLLLGVVLTGSRMGLLLGLAGGAGALWSYGASGLRILPARGQARLAPVATAVAGLVVLAAAAVRSGVVERLAVLNAGESRAAMLAPLMSTAKAFMPFGAGFGAFDSVYRRFEPRPLLSTIYMNQAHNEPLQLAIEGGAPALVLLTLFLGLWAWTTTKLVRPTPPTRDRVMGAAFVSVTAILMVSSLVDYPLRTPLLSSLFAVAWLEMKRSTRRGFAETVI